MIDKKRITEAEKNVPKYIQDGWLFIKHKDITKYGGFFLKNAETSLITAQTLFEVSIDSQKKTALTLDTAFESYLWVVVSAYYSMFYAALALLAKYELKVGDKLVHKVVADTLIVNFLKNQRLAKLLEPYETAKDNALQLVGTDRASELIAGYEHERKKRSDLQYELGSEAKQNLAKTSLERATNFVSEVRNILKH